MRRLFANSTFSAVFCTVLAVFAIFAGVARVCTRAGRGENVERDLIEEKYQQHDLSCE
jgi:hypothetical protein